MPYNTHKGNRSADNQIIYTVSYDLVFSQHQHDLKCRDLTAHRCQENVTALKRITVELIEMHTCL